LTKFHISTFEKVQKHSFKFKFPFEFIHFSCQKIKKIHIVFQYSAQPIKHSIQFSFLNSSVGRQPGLVAHQLAQPKRLGIFSFIGTERSLRHADLLSSLTLHARPRATDPSSLVPSTSAPSPPLPRGTEEIDEALTIGH
jgi:hypothetical protein